MFCQTSVTDRVFFLPRFSKSSRQIVCLGQFIFSISLYVFCRVYIIFDYFAEFMLKGRGPKQKKGPLPVSQSLCFSKKRVLRVNSPTGFFEHIVEFSLFHLDMRHFFLSFAYIFDKLNLHDSVPDLFDLGAAFSDVS